MRGRPISSMVQLCLIPFFSIPRPPPPGLSYYLCIYTVGLLFLLRRSQRQRGHALCVCLSVLVASCLRPVPAATARHHHARPPATHTHTVIFYPPVSPSLVPLLLLNKIKIVVALFPSLCLLCQPEGGLRACLPAFLGQGEGHGLEGGLAGVGGQGLEGGRGQVLRQVRQRLEAVGERLQLPGRSGVRLGGVGRGWLVVNGCAVPAGHAQAQIDTYACVYALEAARRKDAPGQHAALLHHVVQHEVRDGGLRAPRRPARLATAAHLLQRVVGGGKGREGKGVGMG